MQHHINSTMSSSGRRDRPASGGRSSGGRGRGGAGGAGGSSKNESILELAKVSSPSSTSTADLPIVMN